MRACVAVTDADPSVALAKCREAAQEGADLIEVRFDLMGSLPSDLSEYIEIKAPLIATLRDKAQGGRYEGDAKAKLRFLKEAVKNGFSLIDLEIDFPLLRQALEELDGARIIISHHDFERTPDVSAILHTLINCNAKGDMAKVAYLANSPGDVLNLVSAAKLYAETGNDFVAISMGERGMVTRACHERIGTAFTYASLAKGSEVAPGQIDLASLKRLQGEVMITGVTGQSLSHSLSAWMHNAAYQDLGLPGMYFKFTAEREQLPDLLELLLDLDFLGTNVTIPHKQAIMPLLDHLDPEAERIGAVNTVKNVHGDLVGHNTDVHGVEMTFSKAGVDPAGHNVLVMGAGGAARAVCAYLSRRKAKVFLANRTREKAEQLAKVFDGIEVITLNDISGREYRAVVNCTPLGMKGYPDELSVPRDVLMKGQFVMDTIYNPARTKLVQTAEEVGAVAVSGRDMLIYQAMKAFEIWTGRTPRYEVMLHGFQEGISR